MSRLLIGGRLFQSADFQKEEELERVVVENSNLIFGKDSVYLDIKRKVNSQKGDIASIPDGYVISFSGGRPKLYVIENEIASHDVYEDIGLQLWRFASSFNTGSRRLKSVLLEEIKSNPKATEAVSGLMEGHYPNFSELLDSVVFDSDYGFIVIIDETSEELNFVLRQLATQPDIIELKKYTSEDGEVVYQFSEFQEEIKASVSKGVRNIADVDTIVCPANKEGFGETFLGENRWYAIRMSPSIIPQIKYVAMYETAPISSVRWIGTVKTIRPYKDSGKFEVVLTDREQLPKPIKLTAEEGRRGIAPRSPRYTKLELIKKAQSIGDFL
jgi:hypothetical protein